MATPTTTPTPAPAENQTINFFGDTDDADTPDEDLDLGSEIDADGGPADPVPTEPKPADKAEEEPANEDAADVADTEEADDSSDPEPEPEPAPEPAKPRNEDQRIPKSRFDEVNNRYKALQKEIEELRSQQPKSPAKETPTFDFEGKERAYMEAVVDGEFDKAQAIRTEIRAAEQAAFEARATAIAEESGERAVSATQQALDFNKAVADVRSLYKELDHEGEFKNDAAIEEVVELRDVYIQRGTPPAEALRKAARLVAADYGFEATSEAPAADTKPPKQEKPVAKPRSADEVRRNAKTAVAQPPKHAAGSQEDETIDIMNMSEEEFDRLPEKVLAQLRGDFG